MVISVSQALARPLRASTPSASAAERASSWWPMFFVVKVSVSARKRSCDSQLRPSRQMAAASAGWRGRGALPCCAITTSSPFGSPIRASATTASSWSGPSRAATADSAGTA